ncbi:MAG TPA: sugar ABC transporter ATP-binding protein [Bauldia sp.]|nr:sugar ABC transporter ATP-binding protein [Bauldia sp.]
MLEAERITKRFGGIVALNGVHFSASAGEVHAILGENGAGKSTFIQIVSGALQPDGGEIRVRGEPYRPRDPRDARARRIAPVFQELSLIPDLTVAENIWFGVEDLTVARTISRRRLDQRTRDLFASLGLGAIAPETPVRQLSIGARQLVEIAKGLAEDPDILILDEATSALVPDEVDWLLDLARKRADAGRTVLYISHRMAEVRRIADRVTVLRNGETVGTDSTAKLSDDDIVAMMLGRRLNRLFPERKPTARDAVALEVTDLRVGHRLRGASFALRAGEVLGVAGLQGHGQRELFMALFGMLRSEGAITVRGTRRVIRSPRHALGRDIGMALLPEDRRGQGLLLEKPIRENLVLAALRRVVRHGFLDLRREREMVAAAMAQLQIKAESAEQAVGTLSGGNQQKVVLAKLLATEASILLFYDPTRGVDVGTKAEIFTLMRDLAARGMAILFYSTDLTELCNVADRCLVMSYGQVAGVLEAAGITEDHILGLTLAGKAAA